MQDYRNIQVWRQAHSIALGVYELTKSFPPEERFGIVQQMRRAAVSVAANIAEGSKKIFRRDYVRFLNMAECSLREVDYFLLLAEDLHLGDETTVARLRSEANTTARMLTKFRVAIQNADRRLRSKLPTPESGPDS